MIEARATWTLEGPDDTITFSPTSEFVLTEKPRTAVDDRRDTYEYPLDDGAYIGDAYAGARLWTLKGILREDSHSARNVSMQRLNALLNSLRRADGLLKWDPEGFPAVQSTVRRAGSVDFSGGAGLHVPFTFGLIAGDPRVYSQTENTETVTITTETLGTEMLTANQVGIETNTNGWEAESSYSTIARSTTTARTGSASLRVNATVAGVGDAAGAKTNTTITVTPGTTYKFQAYGKTSLASANGAVNVLAYTAGGLYAGGWSASGIALNASSFTELAGLFHVPSTSDIDHIVMYVVGSTSDNSALGTTDYFYFDDMSLKPATLSGSGTVTNAGDATSPSTLLLSGPLDDPGFENVTAAAAMSLSTSIVTGEALTVASASREIYVGSELTALSNRYDAKSAADPFIVLAPGDNLISLSGSGSSGTTELEVRWRDAWMP
jgi:hypothetical protein